MNTSTENKEIENEPAGNASEAILFFDDSIKVIIALALVFANGIIGHNFAPYGILLTPVIVTASAWLICFKTKRTHIIIISILTYSALGINDILIKLYSGGIHDGPGQAVTNLFFFFGLVPVTALLISSLLLRKKNSISVKVISILIFASLIFWHVQKFHDLGFGKHY
jgi:hypothetical protein